MGIPIEEFRRRRKALGLTQRALAARLEISTRGMENIEAKAEVPMRYVLALAAIEAEMREGTA